MEFTLQRGMQVVLSAIGKSKYADSKWNPHHDVGVVDEVYEDEDWDDNELTVTVVSVYWSHGDWNSYLASELQPAYPPNTPLGDFL